MTDNITFGRNSLSSTPLRFLPFLPRARERAALDRNRMLILFYLTRSPGSHRPSLSLGDRADQGEWSNQITQDTITLGRYTGKEVFVAWISLGKRTIQVWRGNATVLTIYPSYVRGEEQTQRGLAWGCEKRSHTYQAWPISPLCNGFQQGNFCK